MFSALLEGPVVVVTRDDSPIVFTAWMDRVDPLAIEKALVDASRVITDSRWMPVSALDVATDLPPPEVDEALVRREWFHRPSWHRNAACRGNGDLDPYFFGVDDEKRPALSGTGVRIARDYCRRCPVILQCLSWALVSDERFGIWGGTTGRDRITMRRRLKAGETTIEELVSDGIREAPSEEGPGEEGSG